MTSHEDSERFWDVVGGMDTHYSPVERAANDQELVRAYLDWWNVCTTSPDESSMATQTLKDRYTEISMRYGLSQRDYLSTMNLIAERLSS